jgi:hypothetical protein
MQSWLAGAFTERHVGLALALTVITVKMLLQPVVVSVLAAPVEGAVCAAKQWLILWFYRTFVLLQVWAPNNRLGVAGDSGVVASDWFEGSVARPDRVRLG